MGNGLRIYKELMRLRLERRATPYWNIPKRCKLAKMVRQLEREILVDIERPP